MEIIGSFFGFIIFIVFVIQIIIFCKFWNMTENIKKIRNLLKDKLKDK